MPSPGPFEALRFARELEAELVAASSRPEALARAIRTAFELPDDRVRDYRRRAAALLRPYGPEAVQQTVSRDVLPALVA